VPSSTLAFEGYIKNFAVWDIHLSDELIETIFGLGRNNKTTLSSKLFYIPGENHKPDDFLEKDSISIFYDSSGNDNHSQRVSQVTITEEFNYADVFPINFPSASEIFGV
jgi:hypothetical protein